MANFGSIILILLCVGIGYVLQPIFFGDSSALAPSGIETSEPTMAKESLDSAPTTQVPPQDEPSDEFVQPLEDIESTDMTETAEPTTITPPTHEETLEEATELNNILLGIKPPPSTETTQEDVEQEATSTENTNLGVENPPEMDLINQPVKTKTSDATENQTVAIMKLSIAAGEVTTFSADQASKWKAIKPVDYKGETYEAGQVSFKMKTILGMQKYDAIALINNGVVVRWVWGKNMRPMK